MIYDMLSVRPEHVELVTSQLRKKLAVSSAVSLLLVEFTTLTDYLHYLQAVSQALAMCGHVAMMLLAAAVSDFYVPTSDLVSAESFMTLFVSPMYTVGHKKRATLFVIITPMFRGGFSHFLHQGKQEKVLYRGITKFATSPQLCLYTAWEKLKTHTQQHILKPTVSVF